MNQRLNRFKNWAGNQDAHKWIGSLATIVQAGAVIWGICFAATQLKQSVEGVNREKRNATFEILRRLHSPELRDVMHVIYSDQRKSNGEYMTLDEYSQATRPLYVIADEAMLCVNVGKCDLREAQYELCPLLLLDDFVKASYEKDKTPRTREVNLHPICSPGISDFAKIRTQRRSSP